MKISVNYNQNSDTERKRERLSLVVWELIKRD